MWIATTTGFLSAVQANHDATTLVVRSRVKADLTPLIEFSKDITGREPGIITYDHSDYPWRILVPRTVWGRFVADQAMRVDYGNFKDAVGQRQGKPRAHVYGSVWSALLGLERLDPERRATSPWWGPEDADDESLEAAYDDMDDDDEDWLDVDAWLAEQDAMHRADSIHDLTDDEVERDHG